MPAHTIRFKHSAMPTEYIGKATKYAHTREEAIALMGTYHKKANVVVDKYRNRLTIIGE
tara:strand:+ start:575 stop:751 length:177 start_codon:yes stop_codon:yes gene_type:complete